MSAALLPLLVGEANPYSDDPDDALLPYPAQSAGARLCRLIGWGEDAYLTAFDRCNLIDGRDWNMREARACAEQIKAERIGSPVIMLGAKVAAAFELSHVGLFAWSGWWLRLPHPSGRCREWDKPGARARLAAALACFDPRLVVRPVAAVQAFDEGERP